MDYRTWLQGLADSGNKDAQLGLDYQGNDINNGSWGINSDYLSSHAADSPEISTLSQLASRYNDVGAGGGSKYPGTSDPNGTGGTTNGSATGDDAANLAYLDDSEGGLRGLLDSAKRTLGNGLTQIGDTFDSATNRAKQTYDTALEDTTRAKTGAINQVNTGARTLNDSLRRMLGLASGSNSSAYQLAAPNAVARDASQKRTGVVDTFGRNTRDLDTSNQQTIGDLASQRREKESGLREGVLGQEQGIYAKLADIARQRTDINGGSYDAIRASSKPYQDEIATRQTALDNLFSQFRTPFTQTAAPKLADYTVDPSVINTRSQNGGSEYSPYSLFLKKKQQIA